ncbi:MAG TPA: hypothetical protein VFG62_05660, partial [Rhodopila sp.]|nr:hypothetical protein [Rhodopila sp.]
QRAPDRLFPANALNGSVHPNRFGVGAGCVQTSLFVEGVERTSISSRAASPVTAGHTRLYDIDMAGNLDSRARPTAALRGSCLAWLSA